MLHSRYSPSSSHRWIYCPGSIDAGEDIEPIQDNEPAEIGTGAHAVGEYTLRRGRSTVDESLIGTNFPFRYDNRKCQFEITPTAAEYINIYTERVMEIFRSRRKNRLLVEYRADLNFVHPQMFGHSDAVIDQDRNVTVTDFKYGFVAVHLVGNPDALLFCAYDEADINTQLLCYAAAALEQFLWLPETVTMEIVQPRCFEVEPIQSVTVPTDFVFDWIETVLRPAAQRTDEPNAPLIAGDWCRFCPAKILNDGSTCPAFAEHTSQALSLNFKDFIEADAAKLPAVEQLNTDQLLNILRWTPMLDAFLREVNAFAFQKLMSGSKELAGYYKLVRGRGSRYWPHETPEENAKEIANYFATNGSTIFEQEYYATEEGFNEICARVFEPLTMKSPKQVEDIGRFYKQAVTAIALKRKGNLTLAVDSDKRKAIEPLADFADDGTESQEERVIDVKAFDLSDDGT